MSSNHGRKQQLCAPNIVQEHPWNIAVNKKNLCFYCCLEQRQRSSTCTKLNNCDHHGRKLTMIDIVAVTTWIVFDFKQASSEMSLVSANSFAYRHQWVTKIVITREVLANACCQFWSLHDLKFPVPKIPAKLWTLALWKYYQTNRHNYYSNFVLTHVRVSGV